MEKLVKISLNMCDIERKDLYAELNSKVLVENLFTENRRINDLLDQEENESIYWTGEAESLMESLGYKEITSDNTYNHESDLSDIMQFAIWTKDGSKDFYDDGIILIQFHHGGDARGNYGNVRAYDWLGEDSLDFLQTTVGWVFSEGTNSQGELDHNALRELDEKFQTGYHANPTYALQKEIESIISVDENSATIVLKSGETVKAVPTHNAE